MTIIFFLYTAGSTRVVNGLQGQNNDCQGFGEFRQIQKRMEGVSFAILFTTVSLPVCQICGKNRSRSRRVRHLHI